MKSQNLRVKGPSPASSEHPPGEELIATLRDQLEADGLQLGPIDNWRDCGWSLPCVMDETPHETVLVWDRDAGEWFIQIYPVEENSSADASKTCTTIATAVGEALATIGFTTFRWTIDGDPASGRASALPRHPRRAADAPIAFPVLAIANDSFIVMSAPPRSGTAKAIRSGYFEHLDLLDSQGRLWPVVSVVAPGMGMLASILNKTISVDLEVGDPIPAHVPAVVKRLCLIVDNDPDDIYSQVAKHEDLKAELRTADHAKDLIELVAKWT